MTCHMFDAAWLFIYGTYTTRTCSNKKYACHDMPHVFAAAWLDTQAYEPTDKCTQAE